MRLRGLLLGCGAWACAGVLLRSPGGWRPHVVYVNLQHRADRRIALERALARAGWPAGRVHRLNATAAPHDGLYGCNDSHARALEAALAQQPAWGHVLVLEDDVVFRDADAAVAQLEALAAWDAAAAPAPRRWDVALLSGLRREVRVEEPVEGARGPPPGALSLRRAHNYQSTAAYLVHAEYLRVLLANAREATAAMLAEGPSRHAWNSFDQYWKRLQARDGWVHFEPMLLDQAPGVSDITGRHADYAAAYGAFEAGRAQLHAGHEVRFLYDWSTNHYDPTT